MKRKSYHFLQKTIIIILLFILIANALVTRLSTRNTSKIVIPLIHKITAYRNTVSLLHLETEEYLMLDSAENKDKIMDLFILKGSLKLFFAEEMFRLFMTGYSELFEKKEFLKIQNQLDSLSMKGRYRKT